LEGTKSSGVGNTTPGTEIKRVGLEVEELNQNEKSRRFALEGDAEVSKGKRRKGEGGKAHPDEKPKGWRVDSIRRGN